MGMNIREAIFLAKMVFKWVATVLGHLNRLVDKHILKRASETLFFQSLNKYTTINMPHIWVYWFKRAHDVDRSRLRALGWVYCCISIIFKHFQGYVYEGNWENDRMEGQGRLSMPDGSVFEGQFQNGKFHGHGVYCWSDGSKYEGTCINSCHPKYSLTLDIDYII